VLHLVVHFLGEGSDLPSHVGLSLSELLDDLSVVGGLPVVHLLLSLGLHASPQSSDLSSLLVSVGHDSSPVSGSSGRGTSASSAHSRVDATFLNLGHLLGGGGLIKFSGGVLE
jgi:hypothetical protein